MNIAVQHIETNLWPVMRLLEEQEKEECFIVTKIERRSASIVDVAFANILRFICIHIYLYKKTEDVRFETYYNYISIECI